MKVSAPMRLSLIFGLAIALGAGCGSSGNLHGDSGTDAASAAGGASGHAGSPGSGGAAGKSGSGGAPGSGGSGAGGAPVVDAGADAPGVRCGNNFCTGGTYCCNSTCGTCAPRGALCPAQICGSDASSSFDAFGCVAIPMLDDDDCGGRRPPHFYSCVLADLPPPCVVLNMGNVTDSFCCP